MAVKHMENEKKRLLALPLLREGHGIETPQTFEWTESPGALGFISKSIAVGSNTERNHSIPDIFSQSIQFEFDLSIHKKSAVDQWQGLLATLLLSSAYGLVNVRTVDLAGLADSPFYRVLRQVMARRGIRSLTLFELRQRDGHYSPVAFRYEGMKSMLCPAAQLKGQYSVSVPWIVGGGDTVAFTAPTALVQDKAYDQQRLALRNVIYELSIRRIPQGENKDGLQLQLLKEFYQALNENGGGTSTHPINEEVRARLSTTIPVDALPESPVFTGKLCLFKKGPDDNYLHVRAEHMHFIEGGSDDSWFALLPLKQQYAKDRLEALAEGSLHVSMRWDNGAVIVELRNEADGAKQTKRYPPEEFLNFTSHRHAPMVAVWPPKALTGWHRYYVLRYDDGNALPLTLQVVGTVRAAGGEVTKVSLMPEGIAFLLDGQEVGLILPAFETIRNARQKDVTIGFDFGTTGTTAYLHNETDGLTDPISFAGQGALFLFGRNQFADVALTANFVSRQIEDRSTHYTLLKGDRMQPGRNEALINGSIPLLKSAAFNTEILTDVSDELKWGGDAQNKTKAALFLEQYLMMCLWHACVHGAGSISWRASYPLAMDESLRAEYTGTFESIVKALRHDCYAFDERSYTIHTLPESESVGFMMMDNHVLKTYMTDVKVNDETGFFCIDIGGGSTDYSLWQRHKPLAQASLRWAGNAILCDSVTRRSHGVTQPSRGNLLTKFFDQPATEEEAAQVSLTDEAAIRRGKYNALMDLLIARKYDDFRRVWNVLIDEIADAAKGLGRTDPPVLNYMNIIRFNLYLLFFFGGRMLRETIAEGRAIGMAEPLPVAVLGNGAKMLNMLYDNGREKDINRFNAEMQKFEHMFKAGCGHPDVQVVIIEPFLPKEEAACGLSLVPEMFLLNMDRSGHKTERNWADESAYLLADNGTVRPETTDVFQEMVRESFVALRSSFGDDSKFRAFLETLFLLPKERNMFDIEAYYDCFWKGCLTLNPVTMAAGQELPKENTIAGRFVEMLSILAKLMRTA